MKRYFVLILIFCVNAFFVSAQTTYTWTGFNSTNFSDPNNWLSTASPTTIPTSADDILFDAVGNSGQNCLFDIAVDVRNVLIDASYVNVVDAQSTDVFIRGNFSQGGGTFKAPDASSTGGLVFKKPNISITGGFFDNNLGIVTLEVDPANGTAIIAGSVAFNQLDVSPIAAPGQRIVDFGNSTTSVLNISLGSLFCSFQGSITITGDLNLSGTNTSTVSSNNGSFIFSGPGPISINGITGTNQHLRCRLPNVIINTSGDYSISGNINIENSWTATQGTLTAGGTSTVNFMNSTALTGTAVAFDNLNIASTATVSLPANAEVKIGRSRLGTGGLTFQPTTALGLNGISTQTINLSGVTLAAINAYGTSSRNVTLSGTITVLDSISAGASANLITGGNLTLPATASLKGRVGRTAGTISGNVTVETFIPGGATGWANLGVNGVTGQTMASWDTYASSGGVIGLPMTCTGCFYNQTAPGSWFNSIAAWNEPLQDYDTLIVATSSLVTGKGYWVYVGDALASSSDLKLVNTGPLVVGNVNYPISSTTSTITNGFKGMNLVANPYASPISWDKVLAASGGTASGLSESIYVWNADIGASGGVSSYANGVSNPSNAMGITDIIPAGQGFYVETSQAATLVYNESVKMDGNTSANPLLKTAAASSNNYGQIFYLKIKGANDWDETAFRIHQSATPFFDKAWDAHKIFQSPGYAGYPGPYLKYTTISSKDIAGEDYSINSIPSLVQQTNISVLARVSASGTYTIKAKGLENVNGCVMLKDNLLNITQDLKQGDYICYISDTTSATRFELQLCRDLSIDLVSVKEQSASNNVFISQDENGAFVNTAFSQNTKATISVYDIVGQKLMEDLDVQGTVTSTRLNLDLHNQVVLIRVTSDQVCSTRKIVLH